MTGDHADPQSVAAEQHQHFVHAGFTGQVLGVAWEREARLADGVFVDGRGDKDVHRGFCEVPHRHFQALHGHGARLFGGLAGLVLEVVGLERHEVDLA